MSDIVQTLYKRIQKMTPSRLEDAYLMDVAGQEIKRLRKLLDDAPLAIMDTRDVLGICTPEESDFPALYALQGKRVRLVVVEDCATDIRARGEQAKESGE